MECGRLATLIETIFCMDDGISEKDMPLDIVDAYVEGNLFNMLGLPDDETFFNTLI